MSLADAVLEIAQDMEDYPKILNGRDVAALEIEMVVASWVKQLRRAVTAAEGSTPPVNPLARLLTPEAQHMIEIEKAREEFRHKNARRAEAEENIDGTMRECVGGPAHGAFVPTPASMPCGAKTHVLEDQVYQLGEDGKLHHIPPPDDPPPGIIQVGD